jgi:hypothetical protein
MRLSLDPGAAVGRLTVPVRVQQASYGTAADATSDESHGACRWLALCFKEHALTIRPALAVALAPVPPPVARPRVDDARWRAGSYNMRIAASAAA